VLQDEVASGQQATVKKSRSTRKKKEEGTKQRGKGEKEA